MTGVILNVEFVSSIPMIRDPQTSLGPVLDQSGQEAIQILEKTRTGTGPEQDRNRTGTGPHRFEKSRTNSDQDQVNFRKPGPTQTVLKRRTGPGPIKILKLSDQFEPVGPYP